MSDIAPEATVPEAVLDGRDALEDVADDIPIGTDEAPTQRPKALPVEELVTWVMLRAASDTSHSLKSHVRRPIAPPPTGDGEAAAKPVTDEERFSNENLG